jgi:hypothetical protein
MKEPYCSVLFPPTKTTDLRLDPSASLTNSYSIYIANSLDGAIIILYGPSSTSSPYIGGILLRKFIKGIRKAADFPEPVGAKPIMSLNFNPIEIAYI